MFGRFFKQHKAKNTQNEVIRVAEKQLDENRDIIESLRDYDIGKKDISTANVERRMQDIQPAL
jgi:hypothetical protein